MPQCPIFYLKQPTRCKSPLLATSSQHYMFLLFAMDIDNNQLQTMSCEMWPMPFVVVLPRLSLVFFQLFSGFFITENAGIDVTVREMVNNIVTLHTFQIIIKLSKYMQPILKYSKNNI